MHGVMVGGVSDRHSSPPTSWAAASPLPPEPKYILPCKPYATRQNKNLAGVEGAGEAVDAATKLLQKPLESEALIELAATVGTGTAV